VAAAFDGMVDASEFLVRVPGKALSCTVPLLGESVQVFLGPSLPNVDDDDKAVEKDESSTTARAVVDSYTLRIEGAPTDNDAGWIYAKFYESRDRFEGALDTEEALRRRVVQHLNQVAAHPGYAACSAQWASAAADSYHRVQALFRNSRHVTELQEQGYTVIDGSAPRTTPFQHERLSQYLVEKTNQGERVRTDTVNFLNGSQAEACALDDHFHLLMGIASYLNGNLVVRPSRHTPMEPATVASPLTIPRRIQLAEYEHGGFYTAHSDNSLQAPPHQIRSNFRHFTCILYCNEDWQERDGGALRIYLGSRDVSRPSEAKQTCDHVDIFPRNGRLVLFDSCLIHSVERVKHESKVRRALTLWINRPNDSGVGGEDYF
jgi:hypothetical protein